MSKTFKIAFSTLRKAVGRESYQQPHIPLEREREFPDDAADEMTVSDVEKVAGPGRVILFSSCSDFDHGGPDDKKAHLLGEEAFIAGVELVLVARCRCGVQEKRAFALRHGMRFQLLGNYPAGDD